jgi:CIC family chloride channel protein
MMRVGEVMDPAAPIIPARMTVSQLSEMIANDDPAVARRQGTIIVDAKNHLAGIITRGDVVRSLEKNAAGTTTVLEAGKQDLIVTFADELLHDAVKKMLNNNIGRLPVVDRSDPKRVIGYLGRANILAARLKQHEEEELRERGAVVSSLKFG